MSAVPELLLLVARIRRVDRDAHLASVGIAAEKRGGLLVGRGVCAAVNSVCDVVKRDTRGVVAHELGHDPGAALCCHLPLSAIVGFRPGHGVERWAIALGAVVAKVLGHVSDFFERNALRLRITFVVAYAPGRLGLKARCAGLASPN